MASDYGEFYTEWLPKFKTAVWKFGFKGPDVDDIVHDLMLEFMTGVGPDGLPGKPGLERYDPTKGAPSTFVWNFVQPRLLGRRKKARKMASREVPMMMDSVDGEEVEMDFADPINEVEDWESFEDAKGIYSKLSSADGDKKLAELFRAMVVQLSTSERIDKGELAEKFGVSKRRITSWIRELATKRAVLEWAVIHKGKTGVFPVADRYAVWFDGKYMGSAPDLSHANWQLRSILLKYLTEKHSG